MFSSNRHAQHIIFPLKPIHSNREKGGWGGGFGGVERLFDCFAEVFNAQQIFKTALMGLETMHFRFQHSPLIKQNKINHVCGKNPRLREMLPSSLAWLVREEGRKTKNFHFTFSFTCTATGGVREYSLYSSSDLINE